MPGDRTGRIRCRRRANQPPDSIAQRSYKRRAARSMMESAASHPQPTAGLPFPLQQQPLLAALFSLPTLMRTRLRKSQRACQKHTSASLDSPKKIERKTRLPSFRFVRSFRERHQNGRSFARCLEYGRSLHEQLTGMFSSFFTKFPKMAERIFGKIGSRRPACRRRGESVAGGGGTRRHAEKHI